MKVFITGTDTDIGKTLISSWICLHTGYTYFKPIQTGNTMTVDSAIVERLASAKILPEIYSYSQPLAPHLAAKLDNSFIDISLIKLPEEEVVIEGAGGLMVPLNEKQMMVDLMKQLQIPVILVASSKLGTINHTLLSLEALRIRNIPVLGVILNGDYDCNNKEAIEFFGKTRVLACFPKILHVSRDALFKVKLTKELRAIFQV
ncbi:ATP-dependent dethiobiotin synthetase BioD-like [Planococcus citri]|uniref:Dethiobiotin synthase n=1 Tax=Planococcus citri TaxID=170843 RepID=S5NTI1_9HEMI|nr:dethiobiotin synthase [Planococcus citri]